MKAVSVAGAAHAAHRYAGRITAMQADGTTSAVLRSVGLTEDRTARCVPLTGGTFNTVSRVTPTDGGGDWVVKTPPPATPEP